MRKNQVSVCYHPTTTVFVDDSSNFLENVSVGLSNNACVLFHDPASALEFLNKQQNDYFFQRCIAADEAELDRSGHVIVDLDITKIHHEIYNLNRFNHISTLVTDYSMPSLNGLQVCQSVTDHLIHRILLTGEAGHDLAVDAFNRQDIDKFITKTLPNVVDLLTQNIQEMQFKYFLKLSEIALSQLNYFSEGALKCLVDPVFIDFFYQLVEQHDIIEYYLLDEHGSYLMLNAKGEAHFLVVKDEMEMLELSRQVEFEGAPQAIKEAINQKEKIPFFFSESYLKIPYEQWNKYLHPASLLKGKSNYYYSFLIMPPLYPLKKEPPILSYHDYLSCI
jgi:CheY-like chemotaxis protein